MAVWHMAQCSWLPPCLASALPSRWSFMWGIHLLLLQIWAISCLFCKKKPGISYGREEKRCHEYSSQSEAATRQPVRESKKAPKMSCRDHEISCYRGWQFQKPKWKYRKGVFRKLWAWYINLGSCHTMWARFASAISLPGACICIAEA